MREWEWGSNMGWNESSIGCVDEQATTFGSRSSTLLGTFVKLFRTHPRVISPEGKKAEVFIQVLYSVGGWFLPDIVACSRKPYKHISAE